MEFVVDTNVAVVANGRRTNVDLQCQKLCVEKLRSVVADEVIAIDDKGAILQEYMRHLNFSGMPGVGDTFFKHVFDYQYRGDRVRRTPITPSSDDGRGFEELPENTLDRADRKFLAVAAVAKAVVLNATDSDWLEHKALTETLGIQVEQLCPEHAYKTRRRRQ